MTTLKEGMTLLLKDRPVDHDRVKELIAKCLNLCSPDDCPAPGEAKSWGLKQWTKACIQLGLTEVREVRHGVRQAHPWLPIAVSVSKTPGDVRASMNQAADLRSAVRGVWMAVDEWCRVLEKVSQLPEDEVATASMVGEMPDEPGLFYSWLEQVKGLYTGLSRSASGGALTTVDMERVADNREHPERFLKALEKIMKEFGLTFEDTIRKVCRVFVDDRKDLEQMKRAFKCWKDTGEHGSKILGITPELAEDAEDVLLKLRAEAQHDKQIKRQTKGMDKAVGVILSDPASVVRRFEDGIDSFQEQRWAKVQAIQQASDGMVDQANRLKAAGLLLANMTLPASGAVGEVIAALKSKMLEVEKLKTELAERKKLSSRLEKELAVAANQASDATELAPVREFLSWLRQAIDGFRVMYVAEDLKAMADKTAELELALEIAHEEEA